MLNDVTMYLRVAVCPGVWDVCLHVRMNTKSVWLEFNMAYGYIHFNIASAK